MVTIKYNSVGGFLWGKTYNSSVYSGDVNKDFLIDLTDVILSYNNAVNLVSVM